MFTVTEVRVFPVEDQTGNLKAIANITIDNAFAVRGIKVLGGDKGLFIGMPSKKDKNGEFKDIAHPINSESRKVVSDAIISEYERIRNK